MPFLQENTTWIALGSALAGAAAVAVLVLALSYLASARRKAAGTEPAERVERPDARWERKLAELERDLERARAENRRARQLSAISSTIDLDSILSRTLEAAAGLEFVDAAMIVVPQHDAGPVVATVGMTAEEGARQPIAAPPSGRAARAIEVAYRYAAEDVPGDGELIRGGVVVPLRSDTDEAVGTLSVFWRDPEREPADAELAALEELAASAGPAIENGRRFREARKLADLDALTNLHNRRYFHDTLAREVARAHRYDRRLALVVFDIDDFKLINERVGHLAGDSVLAHLADRVRSVVRSADIACRVGGDEFAVILPESALTDAEQLYRRLQFALSARPTASGERLHLSAGVAELAPEDDAVSFFERADEALFRAKETGKGQAVAAS